MRRTIFAAAAGLALLAAACGPGGLDVQSVQRMGFIPQVADFEGNVGAGVSVTTDADGNPHLAYLAFEAEPVQGEPPAQALPGDPELPAVKHAHLIGGVWTRSVVADKTKVKPEDATAIAVDADGVHHVVWTEGGSLRYSNTAGGDFSKPQTIVSRGAIGPSITADGRGSPWVAFYEDVKGPEGPASLVRVATKSGNRWSVDTAAEAAAREPRTTGIGVGGDGAIVAYGDGERTMVARQDGDVFRSETADPMGGRGVSLALDADGNPHVAYYTPDGDVGHSHSIRGSRWEISDVGSGGGEPAEGATTSIALDEEGIHHVAWQTAIGVSYVNNETGEFEAGAVAGGEAGAHPSIAAGAEGAVHLAWYDTEDQQAILGVRSDEEPLLAVPSPEEEVPEPPDGGGGPAPCEPDGTSLAIDAPQGAAVDGFAEDCLAAPEGEAFTIEFDNQDEGQMHNVAIYTEQGGEALFNGEIFTAPDTMTYEVEPLDAGTLFFQCDVHPATMTGTFVVQ